MPSRFRRLLAEVLERRSVLNGDVTVAVVAGDLVITGDAGHNYINVWQDAGGDWMVAGFYINNHSATTTNVNGQATPQTFSGVTGDLLVDMGDGDDHFILSQGEVL